jgi:hypothetical protein
MPILDPFHLFDQADRMVTPIGAGAPRQVDLRRAISSAYYGLFHFCLSAAADEFVGVGQRATPRYALVYRSIDHRILKDICIEVCKQRAATKYVPYIPRGGFDPKIQAFATAATELQERRHLADYDPMPRFRTPDAKLAVSTARSAVSQFDGANVDHRKAFLTLLICPPR